MLGLSFVVRKLKVDHRNLGLDVGSFLSGGDQHVCAEHVLGRTILILQDIGTHSDSAISASNGVRYEPQIPISRQPILKSQSTQGNGREVDIFAFLHTAHILVTAVISQHVDHFQNFSHPKTIHIEHLVLLAER